MEYSRKNMNWPPESFHPSANSDTICIHSISLHSSNRVLLCLNWVGCWARWWSVQKTERNHVSYLVKLKLMLFQYSGHLMQRADSLEKTLVLGKTEGGRRRGWQRMRWLGGITDSKDMSLSELLTLVKELVVSDSHRVGHNLVTDQEQQSCEKCLENKVEGAGESMTREGTPGGGGLLSLDLKDEDNSAKDFKSLVAQTVMSQPAMQQTRVRSLGWEDPLEMGMATHSSTFTWRSPWGRKESDTTKQQTEAKNSSGALNTQNSASTDRMKEVDSVVATANTYSVLPEGLELSTLQVLTHLILTTTT